MERLWETGAFFYFLIMECLHPANRGYRAPNPRAAGRPAQQLKVIGDRSLWPISN